jgi:hypothetical protein
MSLSPKYRFFLLCLTSVEICFFLVYFRVIGYEKSTGYPDLTDGVFAVIMLTSPMWVIIFTPNRHSLVLRAMRAIAMLELAFPVVGLTLGFLWSLAKDGIPSEHSSILGYVLLVAIDVFCLVTLVALNRMGVRLTISRANPPLNPVVPPNGEAPVS